MNDPAVITIVAMLTVGAIGVFGAWLHRRQAAAKR